MKKHSYFLQIEQFTKAVFETDIIDSDIKVIVPSDIPEKFMVLNTEKNRFKKTSPETDIKKLEKTYGDFDFFYLCISEEMNIYTEFVLCSSDDEYVDDVIAFVGIQKNDDLYTKSKQDYLDRIRVALENYYNQINEWDILVMDEQCDEHPEEYYSYVVDDFLLRYDDEKFDPESEEWFKNCGTKYGITQQEIDRVKNIIKSYKWADKSIYKIKNSTSLPITLGKNGFKQDLYAIKHLLITGRTGTGKTTLLKSILTSINRQAKNANCKIILIDTKNFDFNGYSSTYLITPVITDAVKAVEYLSRFQVSDEDVAIVIDELADLIAVKPDIQNILVNLAENPKIHIIAATRKIDLLSVDFMEIFQNRVAFNIDKVGECLYFSNETNDQISFKTIYETKEQ